jgi:hypothetical protein
MKAPPTIPGQPAAIEDDPIVSGITIVSSRDCGIWDEWVFEIKENEDAVAVNALLDALDSFLEFSLADHSRQDSESCATYRKSQGHYKFTIGGHGWSSDWETIDRVTAFAMAHVQAIYNHGPGPYNCGRLTRGNKYLSKSG